MKTRRARRQTVSRIRHLSEWYWIAAFQIFLFSCSSPSLPVTSTSPAPAVAATCPPCPTSACTTKSCPATICPRCPATFCPRCPVVSEPATVDWSCLPYRSSRGQLTNGCMVQKDICQAFRQRIIRQGAKPLGDCVPQKVAYCFQILARTAHNRQTLCLGTATDCRRVMGKYRATPEGNTSLVTECVPALNSDLYDGIRIHRAPVADES